MIVGYGLYGFALLGWIPLETRSPLECLIFGALISATDPVATLAILGSDTVNTGVCVCVCVCVCVFAAYPVAACVLS